MKRLLIKTALKSHREQRHATLVLKGGAILAVGYNTPERHSEVNALRKLWPSKRRGCSIINLRLTKGGRIADSTPCERCREFLRESGVRKVRVIA